jgi:hypothetical protein
LKASNIQLHLLTSFTILLFFRSYKEIFLLVTLVTERKKIKTFFQHFKNSVEKTTLFDICGEGRKKFDNFEDDKQQARLARKVTVKNFSLNTHLDDTFYSPSLHFISSNFFIFQHFYFQETV